MDYMSTQQVAKKWGVTPRRVQALIEANRIEGVIRFGHVWMIPKDAEKPSDGRKNNRRQPKKEVVRAVVFTDSNQNATG